MLVTSSHSHYTINCGSCSNLLHFRRCNEHLEERSSLLVCIPSLKPFIGWMVVCVTMGATLARWQGQSASADGASSWFLCSSRTHLGPLSDCCSDGRTPGPLHLSNNWEASHQLHLHIFVHEWFCTLFFCSFFCGSWWTTWTFWWKSQFVQLTEGLGFTLIAHTHYSLLEVYYFGVLLLLQCED